MENQEEFLDSENIERIYDIEKQKIISLKKFIFLYIISCGLYGMWWVYKSWRFFQQKEKSNIMPAVRTFFSIFFLYSFFKKILYLAKEKGYTYGYSAILLFVGFIFTHLLVTVISYMSEPLGLISIFNFVFLIPSFKALNFAKQKSTDFIKIEQESFNGRQIVLIVLGAMFWILILIGLFLPE